MGIARCAAFDCFGTVFDVSKLSKDDIRAYSRHVKAEDFTPYEFPPIWYELDAHPDSAEGIRLLRAAGIMCVTLSNGGADLLRSLSDRAGIVWDHITDLAAHRAYKPNNRNAYLAIQKDCQIAPKDTVMVTANPTFGDVEGSQAVGMRCQVIRHGHPSTIPALLSMPWFGGHSV